MKEKTQNILLVVIGLPVIFIFIPYILQLPDIDYLTPLQTKYNNAIILDDRYLGYLALIEMKILCIIVLIGFIGLGIYLLYLKIREVKK